MRHLTVIFLLVSCCLHPQRFWGALGSGKPEDFYKILKVPRGATQQEIKKAFRKLSMEYHPDRDRTPGANERFSKITAAYDVLSDPKKREIYDLHGHEGLANEMPKRGDFNMFNFFNSFGFEYFERDHESVREKTESIVFPLYLTMEQLYLGEFFYITLNRPVLCLHADECIVSMPSCVGPGVKMVTQRFGTSFLIQNHVTDNQCIGPQKKWKANCAACPNGRTEFQKTRATVFVEKGMANQDTITLEGIGNQAIGMEPGDVIFSISMMRNSMFTRKGDNLYTTVYLTMVEALTGFSMELPHFNKTKFHLSRNVVSHDGEVIQMKGLGMPTNTKSKQQHVSKSKETYGDLYITLRVKFPLALSPEAVNLVMLAFKNVTDWKHND